MCCVYERRTGDSRFIRCAQKDNQKVKDDIRKAKQKNESRKFIETLNRSASSPHQFDGCRNVEMISRQGRKKMSKLTGKVAVVTGASKGIGAAIAKALGAAGASVVVNYASDKTGAESVVKAITASGSKAVAVQGDVSKTADAKAIIDTAIKSFGKLDVVVNNSGVYHFAPLEAVTEEVFHKQLTPTCWVRCW
jgi:3-oxoacyl-ACP reductase-like protein